MNPDPRSRLRSLPGTRPAPAPRLLALVSKPVFPVAAGTAALGLLIIITSLVPQRDARWLVLGAGIFLIALAAAGVLCSPPPARSRHARPEFPPPVTLEDREPGPRA